jgi:hypothetical protein
MEKNRVRPARPSGANRGLTRRQLGRMAAAMAGAAALPAAAQTVPGGKPWVVDMHSHYGMFLPRLFGMDLNKHMRENGIALLAWAVVDDRKWISATNGPLRQVGEPQPGEIWAYWQSLVKDYEGRLAQWKVTKALTPADVDRALAGEPHVLLACESANFLEGQPQRLAEAHALGVRHLQLMHYIRNPLGDHQTARPEHGRLTPLGAQVVSECKRLGIVVDLAHSTAAVVGGAGLRRSTRSGRKAGANGFLCMTMPEEYGGAGADKLYSVIQMEELNAGECHRHRLRPAQRDRRAVHPALRHDAQKRRFLPKMASGEMIGAIAMSEPAAGSDLQGVRPPRSPGRPLPAQRLQDLHHQRLACRPGDRGGQDQSRRPAPRAPACCWSSAACPASRRASG